MPTENTRLINYKDNKATALIRGKSPPSEHVLEKIKSNKSLGFKDVLEREIIFFWSKYPIFVFLHVYFNKLSIISFFISITLKFAIFTF